MWFRQMAQFSTQISYEDEKMCTLANTPCPQCNCVPLLYDKFLVWVGLHAAEWENTEKKKKGAAGNEKLALQQDLE